MSKLIKELLGTKYNTGLDKEGWQATFYPSGQPKAYGYYPKDGGDPIGWSIHFGDNDGTGWVEYHKHWPFPRPEEQDLPLAERTAQFEACVQDSIKIIAQLAYAHKICDFCRKKNNQVRFLINGGSVMICDECVSLYAEISKDLLQ